MVSTGEETSAGTGAAARTNGRPKPGARADQDGPPGHELLSF